MMRTSDFLRRYGFWIVFVVAAALYYRRFSGVPAGMELYPFAAACLLNGEILQTCAPGFTYPPAFAFIMIPFAPLNMGMRNVLWYLITIGATILSYRFCEILARRLMRGDMDETELFWLRFFSLSLSLKFILAVFENQAYDTLTFLFIMIGLLALARGRAIVGGGGLAVAAALKATALIFLPYLLFRRRFAAAAVFGIALVTVSLLPDLFFTPRGASEGYLQAWLYEVAGPSLLNNPGAAKHVFWMGPNLLNHSLRGAVSLNVDNPAALVQILRAVDAGFIAVVGFLLFMAPRKDEFVAVDGSLLVMSMLMLSPMTSQSHYVALLLPYTVLVAVGLRDRTTQALGINVLVASFILATATSNDAVGKAISKWAYAHSFLVLGVLILLVYFAPIILKPNVLRSRPDVAKVTVAGV